MIHKPIHKRGSIPIYTNKSESEYRADKYEYFDHTLVRLLKTQYCLKEDPYFYSKQKLSAYFSTSFSSVLEVGCGTGNLIGPLAQKHPKVNFYGIDYSYQMLRCAHEIWTSSKGVELKKDQWGFTSEKIEGKNLSNIQWGMAKASTLPFEKESMDLIFSHFLWDRLDSPTLFLEEVYRILKKGGVLITASPNHFDKTERWSEWHSGKKYEDGIEKELWRKIEKEGFELIEPIDAWGNSIHWKVIWYSHLKK